jgi:hypothetical protein
MAAATFAVAGSSAQASGFSPGDIVVYRVGSGSGALSSSAVPVFLSEYEPSGKLVESVALPTAASGSNEPLLASGSASSEGLLTLSANGEYLMATGYDASLGTAKVGETSSSSVPRTIARVGAGGEINTATALTDAASGNNVRSATSSDGTHIWVAGAAGGVRYTTLGSSTSTPLYETDKNVRQVSIFDGQLYTSADPTKTGALTVATVGSGLPTTSGQTIANLPFSSAPKEPYAYSFLVLGMGPSPDTMYVADEEAGAVVKYGLVAGKWTNEGSVTVADVTGVTANDANGVVSIFATSSGSSGEGGALYKITDTSGLNGTLSGAASLIASAPADEAFRGVAFAPGTIVGSGGAPPPPAPTIAASEASLPAALGDPTNPTLGLTVSDSEYAASELSVTAGSSNTTVAPTASVTGSGGSRTLEVTPGAVGYSTITLTVEAPDGATATTVVNYGVSAYQGDPSDRYYAGAGNASTAIDVGGGYMILGDDESNVLRLYHERVSGEPVKTFDFTGVLPFGSTEMDIEASARVGNTLYWMGSLSNSKKGKLEPARDVVFAAIITGSGADTELTYLGSYTHLREDLIEWDQANGNPLGFAESTANGVPSNTVEGFNVEGLEFASGSTSTAYLAFRAPIEPSSNRTKSLLVPVTDFSSLVTDGNPGAIKATFGNPLEWNLGGLGFREIRKNAGNEYLFIAGTSDDSNSDFELYTWDGNPADQPTLTETPISAVAEGAWENIVSVPEPLVNGDTVELLEDNGDSVWYDDGLDSKDGLPSGLQKDLGRLFTLELPAPAEPGAPSLSQGATPNSSGQFTLAWQPSTASGTATYTLQHEDADSDWSAVAGGLSTPKYAFGAGNPEAEGSWRYRVIESSDGAESAPSEASAEVKVDETSPNAPSVSPDRAPDYAGDGGWYKDSVTVSFAGAGDPTLADGSPGSGVNGASLPAVQTFDTSGSHTVSGTVSDNAGNVSASASLTVQVDATPPSLEISCPASVPLGTGGVTATVTASDGQSGLASDPSGTVPIATNVAGPQTVTRTAVDNVGHETTSACTTEVGYSKVISAAVKKKLTVQAGEAVQLTASASAKSIEVQSGAWLELEGASAQAIKVRSGGSLDLEGATTRAVNAAGVSSVRICGSTVAGAVQVSSSSEALILGDGAGCAPSRFEKGVSLRRNTGGVSVVGNTILGALRVSEGADGATVTNNTVGKTLTVLANSGEVTDRPNTVTGKSKLQ